ncbi:MAG: hypothetical protein U0361_03585 [Nitrospiraceae bacterium]
MRRKRRSGDQSLDPRDIRKLGTYMRDTANITKEEEDSVITEFEKASASGEVAFEGKEFMKAILIELGTRTPACWTPSIRRPIPASIP